jgi:cell division protein FtsB
MVKWEQIKSKIPPFLRNKYVLTVLVFLLWITVFDENSLANWVESKLELRRMKHEKAYYEQQLKNTTDILQELRSNNDSLEKFARERYGFHNPDEDVFVVVE